jgi:hypothetical protein
MTVRRFRRSLTAVLLAAAALASLGLNQKSHAAITAGATRSATLATFAGDWVGQDRSLKITRKGVGIELAYDNCCQRAIAVHFQLTSPAGSSAHATALARVTFVHVYDKTDFTKTSPAPHPGEKKRIRLNNGVISETLTYQRYCGRGAKAGACGA